MSLAAQHCATSILQWRNEAVADPGLIIRRSPFAHFPTCLPWPLHQIYTSQLATKSPIGCGQLSNPVLFLSRVDRDYSMTHQGCRQWIVALLRFRRLSDVATETFAFVPHLQSTPMPIPNGTRLDSQTITLVDRSNPNLTLSGPSDVSC